jgi:hypothetical protein
VRLVPAIPVERTYHATVTIAQIIDDNDTPEASDVFQFEVPGGLELKRQSRKYFRSRAVSGVRIALTPDSSPQVWITQIEFADFVVFRGHARRVHIDAELEPDERISVIVGHLEVMP